MTISRWIPAAGALFFALTLHAQPQPPIPRQAGEFTINMLGGKPLLLSQYKGKPVVLAFILTECGHCQKAVGILTRLQTEYAPRGLQVLAAAIEPDADKHVTLFVRNFKPSFPVGYSNGAQAGWLLPPMGPVPQMPILAFINREGMIVYQTEGELPFFNDEEANMRKQIEQLLKGGTGAPPAKKAAAKKR